jgi:NAD(P)-dependent dehydrogenase (short-subunit alcohol dehydrogenase family)
MLPALRLAPDQAASRAQVRVIQRVVQKCIGHLPQVLGVVRIDTRLFAFKFGQAHERDTCFGLMRQTHTQVRLVPQRRYGEVHEIASAAVFLASHESDYINGHSLNVDGGFQRPG